MKRDVFCAGDQGEKGSPGEKGRTGGFGFPGTFLQVLPDAFVVPIKNDDVLACHW